MRLILTALCMGSIVVAAATLVVIDIVIKLLPVVVVALAAGAVLRIAQRRRGTGAGSPKPPGAVHVPTTAVFIRPSQFAGIDVACRTGGYPRCYTTAPQLARTVVDAEVIDAEVICGVDDHG